MNPVLFVKKQTLICTAAFRPYRTLIGVELTALLSEFVIYSLLFLVPRYGALISLAIDVVLLSPIKAGRAFVYDTAAADNTQIRYRLLFCYFVRGYTKSVSWRLQLWLRMAFFGVLIAFPCVAVRFAILPYITHPAIIAILTVVQLFWSICAVVLLFLRFCRYTPSSFLLSYCNCAREAFYAQKIWFSRRTAHLSQPFCQFVLYAPCFVLIVPLFYYLSKLHLQQAKQVQNQIAVYRI